LILERTLCQEAGKVQGKPDGRLRMIEADDRRAGDVGWQRTLLTVFGWAVLILMLAIVLQVLFARFDINPIATFEADLPVLGRALTLNSLLDFQWHLLFLIALLPAALVWLRDGHVRVDFLYARQSERRRAWIELIGHIGLTAPFLALSIPAAWTFMMQAYASGQGSRNDGLNDLFLIKAVLPIGLGLLAIVLMIDIVKQAKRLR